MTQKRRIPTLPGVDDPIVSASIAVNYRSQTPMMQALTRKRMADWLTVNAGMSKPEAERSVIQWVDALLKNNPDTKLHRFKILARAKGRMLWWWAKKMLVVGFYLPAILWYKLLLLKRKVVAK